MQLVELMGEDAKAAREALNLVELSLGNSAVDELVQLLEDKDHVELIKGLCFIICLLSKLMSGEKPSLVFDAIRKTTDEAAAEGYNADINYTVLNLLDATTGNGGSFYLQAYSLTEPFNVIFGLTSLFQSLVKKTLKKDIEEMTEYLHHYIDETYYN